MVGEVRDPETAEIAVRAALTGHLVLTSIHTNDAPSAMTRLMDWPLCVRGQPVTNSFEVTPFKVGYRLTEANIASAFLGATEKTAEVRAIVAPVASWVVVTRVGKGGDDKNEVIGSAQVPAGRTDTLSIPIKDVTNGSEIGALLVADIGTPGVLEVDPADPGRSVDTPYIVRSWYVWKRVVAPH